MHITLLTHGFRSGHSCQTQLILLVDDILRAMDQHYQVDLIMLDFSKALDTVAHNKLLLKLEHYGSYVNAHLWLQTWLTKKNSEGCCGGRDIKKFKGPIQS